MSNHNAPFLWSFYDIFLALVVWTEKETQRLVVYKYHTHPPLVERRRSMKPITGLLQSRKFWLLVLDTVVSLAIYLISSFWPEAKEVAITIIGILQPVVIAVIVGIFVEDAAMKLNGKFPAPCED